jgi:hypothetical protein
MSIRKLENDDVFVNNMKTKPHFKFSIYNGKTLYRADFADTVPEGNAALFDLNLAIDQDPYYALNFYKEKNSFYLPYI